MDHCKYCGHQSFVKNGFVRGFQRYRCRSCGRNQIEGDRREKYSNSLRKQALAMYLNGSGLRAIGRILNVPYQLVSKWIENAGKIVECELLKLQMQRREISILEMDELYTYVQKKKTEHAYGWLLIGTETKLLQLMSEEENGKTQGNSIG